MQEKNLDSEKEIILCDIFLSKTTHEKTYRFSSLPSGSKKDGLLFCMSGNGIFRSAEGEISLKKGRMIYIPSAFAYSFELSGGKDEKACFYMLEFCVFEKKNEFLMPFCLSHVPVDLGNRGGSDRATGYLFDRIYDCQKRGLPGSGYQIRSEAYKLLYELYDSFFASGEIPFYDEIKKGIKYIENNYLSDFLVEDVAKICGVCISRFHKFFKECTGMTPVEYKNMLKVNSAIEMLRKKDRSIEEISAELNFCNQSYFIRTFKKFTGCTPKEFVSKV